MLSSDLPPAPAYFSDDAAVNARRRPLLEQVLPRELRPLSLEETLAFQRTGAQVLDTREPVEVAAGHLRGSLAVGLEGRYASWCGQVLDPQRPVVLVAAPAGRGSRRCDSAASGSTSSSDTWPGHPPRWIPGRIWSRRSSG